MIDGQDQPQLVIRADASISIGTGHIMRCLTLAKALYKVKHIDISFICREHEGHLCDLIEKQGFSVYRLPRPIKLLEAEDSPPHAAWSGVTWQEDADQTCTVIKKIGTKINCLIVDHYALDYRWEGALRPLVENIFAIDDLADRTHDCDLLLDQNLVADLHTRYSNKVPAHCALLLGPRYAVLQPIYAELHDSLLPKEGPVRRILVSFGGVDRDKLTERALKALLNLNNPDIEVDVVIPTCCPDACKCRQQSPERTNIHLHANLPTLAPLMANADLAIGAAGTTTWERLCLGLPSLIVTLAENQRPIADWLHHLGLVRWLGDKDEASEQTIEQNLAELIKSGLTKEWSLRCRSVVDGKGVYRIITILTITPDTPLLARHANLLDETLLLEWANDRDTRANSFSSDPIPFYTHHIWFQCRLRDLDGCRQYIIETEYGVPIGQVRFDKKDQAWEIGYSLAPLFRGRGLGRPLLAAALEKVRDEFPNIIVLGNVKKNNLPSRKIFESLGFDPQTDGENIVYQRVL